MDLTWAVCVLNWMRWWLSSQHVAEWATVFAELVVAWVIYREVQLSRNSEFFQRVTDPKTNEARRALYEAFFKSPASSGDVASASAQFFEVIKRQKEIRTLCDEQISFFNTLGLAYKKRFWIFRNDLVTILPHATIYLWVLCKAYVDCRRKDAGLWFAKPLLKFTLESVEYVLEGKHSLSLRDGLEEDARTFNITVDDLIDIRDDLKSELRKSI
jgi:hypothetical protein